MQRRGWNQWIKNLLKRSNAIPDGEGLRRQSTNSDKHAPSEPQYIQQYTDSDEKALSETQYFMKRLQLTPGLWERLCDATSEGKPNCLRNIISIAGDAGIIETDTKTAISDDESVTIYSEHHEAISRMDLSSEDSARLCVIVWALEGKRLKR
jgi:hypothetical protein